MSEGERQFFLLSNTEALFILHHSEVGKRGDKITCPPSSRGSCCCCSSDATVCFYSQAMLPFCMIGDVTAGSHNLTKRPCCRSLSDNASDNASESK